MLLSACSYRFCKCRSDFKSTCSPATNTYRPACRDSISDIIRQLLHQNSLMLDRVAHQTRSLRGTHPKVKAPRSVFHSNMEEIGSLIGTDDTATTETSFEFDDLIVNSKVYRRVVSKARLRNVGSKRTIRSGDEHSSPDKDDSPNEQE